MSRMSCSIRRRECPPSRVPAVASARRRECPPSRVQVALPAQFGVKARCAVDPVLGCEDAADVPAQFGFRLGPALSDRDRTQPGVKAADTCADDPAQRGDGMVRPLG
jgi:hypothetical protein